VPIVTLAGETMVARVAGSLLATAGLADLVTTSLADYEALALAIAQDPDRLRALKDKARRARHETPLFDIAGYTRDLERAFEHMMETHRAGLPPAAFAVADLAPTPEETPMARVATARSPDAHTLAPAPTRTPIADASCPLCRGHDLVPLIAAQARRDADHRIDKPETITWSGCGDCGHVFQDGGVGQQSHRCAEVRGRAPDFGPDLAERRAIAAGTVGRVADQIATGLWVDVGGALGGAVALTALEWGYQAAVCDVMAEAVPVWNQVGIAAHTGHITDVPPKGRFAVVSFVGTLERMADPRAVLDHVHAVLRPGGLIVVATPNMDSVVWRALHDAGQNTMWGEPERAHVFSRDRLYALLEVHGFEPLSCRAAPGLVAGIEVIARRKP
jgi:SAM-dependent methyltransferase